MPEWRVDLHRPPVRLHPGPPRAERRGGRR
jgi:hypothetical protein